MVSFPTSLAGSEKMAKKRGILTLGRGIFCAHLVINLNATNIDYTKPPSISCGPTKWAILTAVRSNFMVHFLDVTDGRRTADGGRRTAAAAADRSAKLIILVHPLGALGSQVSSSYDC